uniref:SnoaL-like domain-containing protein n=1 Tax=Panagrolaimus sp. JU765 TaxID=591449 RepID=A0AC34R796_9BILA
MAPRLSEELNVIIRALLAKFEEASKAKDAKALAEFYHPDGVVVSRGKWAAYGRKDIEAKCREWLNMCSGYKVHIDQNLETDNGEYIFHSGKYEMDEKPGELFHYQQIFQKQSDGSYLVYHEEFVE